MSFKKYCYDSFTRLLNLFKSKYVKYRWVDFDLVWNLLWSLKMLLYVPYIQSAFDVRFWLLNVRTVLCLEAYHYVNIRIHSKKLFTGQKTKSIFVEAWYSLTISILCSWKLHCWSTWLVCCRGRRFDCYQSILNNACAIFLTVITPVHSLLICLPSHLRESFLSDLLFPFLLSIWVGSRRLFYNRKGPLFPFIASFANFLRALALQCVFAGTQFVEGGGFLRIVKE